MEAVVRLFNMHSVYPDRYSFYKSIDIWVPPYQPSKASPAPPGGTVFGTPP